MDRGGVNGDGTVGVVTEILAEPAEAFDDAGEDVVLGDIAVGKAVECQMEGGAGQGIRVREGETGRESGVCLPGWLFSCFR